ncbi:MAG: hypothetical protein HY549_09135 [Elusimicrobia bacterium]|nr:hypothetical protein [Elusimicrobiota bacterium]
MRFASRTALLSAIFACSPVFGQGGVVPVGQMIPLSCMEALVEVGYQRFAGVFSFIAEKDNPAAFADLITHDKGALKKYLAKVEKDFKVASGVSPWDHEVLQFAATLYNSPLAQTLEKPGDKLLFKLVELSRAPVVPLEDITSKRRSG